MATEDIELTWRLLLAGWETAYEPRALVGMQVPPSLRALWAQRKRWTRGQGEVIRVHFREGLPLAQPAHVDARDGVAHLADLDHHPGRLAHHRCARREAGGRGCVRLRARVGDRGRCARRRSRWCAARESSGSSGTSRGSSWTPKWRRAIPAEGPIPHTLCGARYDAGRDARPRPRTNTKTTAMPAKSRRLEA